MAELPTRLPLPSQSAPQGPAGWFCEIGGKVHGPLDFRSLKELASSKEISEDTLVWKGNSTDKQEAATILGLFPKTKPKAKEEPIPESRLSDDDPYATPRASTIQDGPPGGLYLPHLRKASFLHLLLAFVAMTSLIVGAYHIPNRDIRIIIYCLGGIAGLHLLGLGLTYLHRAWDMMHMFGGSLNGSKAVRFMILPLFNALWSFVALFGWAKLWNHSQRTHPGLKLASAVWRPLFFLFPIVFLASQGLLLMHFITKDWPTDLTNPNHQISLGTFAFTIVLGMFCWFQMTRAVNFLARKKS
ncbi:DUF4339 domain-containing protein [Akkermansiaceae bacterium]|nr:DUF4339 domain-containing protein [Akkermansiaceae bacterium]